MTKFILNRGKSTKFSTPGELFLSDNHVCCTLEDVVRDIKIPRETAIPAGLYKIKLTYSPRFRKMLPLLLDVPNFTGVRIHSGNRHTDTEGCILVGLAKSMDFISSSKLAFNKVYTIIKEAIDKKDEVWILINDVEA